MGQALAAFCLFTKGRRIKPKETIDEHIWKDGPLASYNYRRAAEGDLGILLRLEAAASRGNYLAAVSPDHRCGRASRILAGITSIHLQV